MSKSVDERIVQMQFENSKFEKNVNTSINSLDKLNKNLNNLNGTSFTALGRSVSSVAERFSNLGIVGMTVISNLTNKVVDLGLEMVKSLTVDNIAAGFEKYSSAIKDVKALMNSTGKDIDELTERIGMLSWYSDATSYSYSAMVSALKNFASQGIAIEEAIPMIMGIGNSLSYAGLAAEEASYAFTVYSKAIGQGHMALNQWRSLNYMNASTENLKKQFIDAAVELGVLQKQANGTIKTLNGLEVSVQSFETTLGNENGKWLTTPVLKKVFKDIYGDYVLGVQELTSSVEKLAQKQLDVTEAMRIYDYVAKYTTKDMKVSEEAAIAFQKEFKDATGAVLSVAESGVLLKYLAETNRGLDEFGTKAFLAAQEARTFTEAVNAVKDAASSAWNSIFSSIFGNAIEATELWTDFSSWLYDIFIGPLELLNKALITWKRNGGRDYLITAFQAWGRILPAMTAPVKKAFSDIYGALTDSRIAKALYDKIYQFGYFGSVIENWFVKRSDKFASIIKGFLTLINVFAKAFSALAKFAGQIIFSDGGILDFFITVAAKIGDLIVWMQEFVSNSPIFNYAIRKFSELGNFLVRTVKPLEWVSKAYEMLSNAINTYILKSDDASARLKRTQGFFDFIDKIVKGIKTSLSGIFRFFEERSGKMQDIFDGLAIALNYAFNVGRAGFNWFKTNVWPFLSKVLDWAIDKLAFLGRALKGITERFDETTKAASKNFDELRDKTVEFFNTARYWVNDFIKPLLTAKNIMTAIGVLLAGGIVAALISFARSFSNFGEVAFQFSKFIKALRHNIDATYLFSIAAGIGAITASIYVLSKLTWEELGRAAAGLGGSLAILFGALLIFRKLNTGGGGLWKDLIGLGVAIRIMTSSIGQLGKIENYDAVTKGIEALGAILAILALFNLVISATSAATGITVDLKKNAASILLLGFAVSAFAGAIKTLGKAATDPNFATGIFTLVGLLVILGTYFYSQRHVKTMVQAAGAMALLGIGLNFLVVPLFAFSKFDLKETGKGLIIIAGALVIFAGALKILSGQKTLSNHFETGFVKQFGASNGKTLIAAATAIGILSTSLLLLVPTLKALSAIENWEDLKHAAEVISIFIALSAVAIKVMSTSPWKNVLAAAGAIAIMAGSMLALAKGIEMLAKQPIKYVWSSVGALAALIIVFGVLSYLLSPISVVVIGIAAAIAILSLAAIGFAAATLILAYAFEKWASISGSMGEWTHAIMQGFTDMCDALIEELPAFFESSDKLFMTFIEELIKSIERYGELHKIDWAVLLGIKTKDGKFAIFDDGTYPAWAKKLDEKMDHLIKVDIPEFGASILEILQEALFQPFLDFFDTIKQGIDYVFGKNEAQEAFTEGPTDILRSSKSEAQEAGKETVEGFAEGIDQNIPKVRKATKGIVNTVTGTIETGLDINSPSKVTEEYGENSGMGFAIGVEDSYQQIKKSTKKAILGVSDGAKDGSESLGGKIVNWFKDNVGKPIKDFASDAIGGSLSDLFNFDKALDFSSNVENAYEQIKGSIGSFDFSTEYTDMANNLTQTLNNAINTDVDLNPTITPVLDWDEWRDGMSEEDLNAILGNSRAIFGYQSGQITKKNLEAIKGITTKPDYGDYGYSSGISFVQNNYSPRALSRVEIYRQTKNELASIGYLTRLNLKKGAL